MKYWLLNLLGIIAFWRWSHRKQISVLMIHGVMSERYEDRWIPLRWQLSPELLEQHLEKLSRHYNFLSADEAVAILSGTEPARNNAMLITIDDGYRNALTHALPVLKKFGVRPILFAVSGMLEGDDYFWFDHLDLCLQETAKRRDHVVFEGERITLNTGSRLQLRDACRRIIELTRQHFDEENARDSAITTFIATLDEPVFSDEFPKEAVDRWIGVMNKDELRRTAASGMDIGSHTVSHFRLPTLSKPEQLEELTRSKRELEEKIDGECKYFCYPEGSTDGSSAKLVEEAGYEAAFTCEPELMRIGSDPMLISRVHLPGDVSVSELLTTVSGLGEYLHRKKLRLPAWLSNRSSNASLKASERSPSDC